MIFDIFTSSGRTILQHAREIFYGGQLAGTSLDVFIQDQDTPPFQYFLMNEQEDNISLVTGTAIGDTTVFVDDGHGFTASGEYMVIKEGSFYTQNKVMSVLNDDITVQAPLTNDFSIASDVVRGTVDMNISGSVSSAIYQLPMWGDTPVDIQTVVITMQHNTTGDDSKFGNLTTLTNGLFFKKAGGPIAQDLGVYQNNQDFRELGATIDYVQKAGGGNHSTNITFDIKKIYGIVIRIDPRINEIFSTFVQDNLNELLRLRVSLMGQFTLGE